MAPTIHTDKKPQARTVLREHHLRRRMQHQHQHQHQHQRSQHRQEQSLRRIAGSTALSNNLSTNETNLCKAAANHGDSSSDAPGGFKNESNSQYSDDDEELQMASDAVGSDVVIQNNVAAREGDGRRCSENTDDDDEDDDGVDIDMYASVIRSCGRDRQQEDEQKSNQSAISREDEAECCPYSRLIFNHDHNKNRKGYSNGNASTTATITTETNKHYFVSSGSANNTANSKTYLDLCEIKNTEGLLDIAIKTINLVKRNQMLQRRLAQLQMETSEFIQSVLANPENQSFRDKLKPNTNKQCNHKTKMN